MMERGTVGRWVWPCLVFGATLAIYLATLPAGLLPGDSGELIAASRTLGIAHPPGYPLYLIMGRLFSDAVRWGSIAYRYNLLSAIVISAALTLIYLVLRHLKVRTPVAVAVALSLGTLEAFWLQATMAEVYPLNALFTALLLYVAIPEGRPSERSLLVLALLGGLALSHHLSLIYPLICCLGILLVRLGKVPGARTIAGAVLLGLIGLSTWLYIPIRASSGPALIWGRTDTLGGFISHVSAQGYRWRLRDLAPLARIPDFLRYFGVIYHQAGVAVVVAAIVGLVAYGRRLSAVAGCAAMVILFAVHFAVYDIPDIESHIFPALIAVGILAGLGLEAFVRAARRLGPRIGLVAVLCCFIIPTFSVLRISPRKDEWFASDYARAIQQSAVAACGDSCIIITSGDISTFPVLYASLVEPGGPAVYDLAASNPSIIGASERPAGLEQCVAAAAEIFGRAGVALVGPMPRYLLGSEPSICGMISLIGTPGAPCRAPTDYEVRGVGQDLREYSSRLLSGSYHLHLARWYAQAGDTASVSEQIGLALASASDDVGTFINAATIYLSMGRIDPAIQIARAAIKVDPDFFEAHDLLANTLLSAGRIDEAIAEYRAALKGNPSPAMLYSNLGNAYAIKGDQSSALEQFGRAIELDSTLVNAYIGMGRTLEALGRPDQALSYLSRARTLDPKSVTAYHAESSLLLGKGDYEGALNVLRQGLDTDPNNPLLLADVGLCYLRMDSLDSTVLFLGRALEGDSTLLTARGNLAVAYERKGIRQKALGEYRKYLETAPPGEHRQQALRAVKRLESNQAP